MGWGSEPGVQLCSHLPVPLYVVAPLGIFASPHLVQSHPRDCSPVLCLHEIPYNNVQLESVLVPRGAAAIRRS